MTRGSRVTKPLQERSRESLERVLEAGLGILVEEGWHDLTLARMCERAGVSVGMLYRRFPGREELLTALQNRWIDDVEVSVRGLTTRSIAWDEINAEEAVRKAIHALVETFRRNEEQTRVFGLHGAFDDEGLRRMQATSLACAAWYRKGLMHHRGAITHPRPKQAIDFSFNVVLDTMIRRTTHGDQFDTGTSIGGWDEFTEELCTVCTAYLFRSVPSKTARRVTRRKVPTAPPSR